MMTYVDEKQIINYIKWYFGVFEIVTFYVDGWYHIYLPITISEDEYNKFIETVEKKLGIEAHNPYYDVHECGAINNFYLKDLIRTLKYPETCWISEGE
jgi:hypothetical protein